MDSIGDRISKTIKNSGLNQKDFAEKIGVTEQAIGNYINNRRFPKAEILLKMKQSFNISVDWLLTGKETDSYIHILSNDRKTKDGIVGDQEIPLYDLEATAGLKELFASGTPSRVLDTIKIPNLPKCDGAITVTGDSMYPLLKSGDIVLYKETHVDNIFFGEMYLLSVQLDEWEEFITVKYIQKSEKGEEFVKLVSQNMHHQPKDVHVSKISALAMVKASIRINTMV